MLTPASFEALGDLVREAHAQSRPIVPSGMGSRAYLGVPPGGDVVMVSSRRLGRVLHYEPDDFTISVQAGFPLVQLREVLTENRQEIPVDFSSRSPGTVGGWIAAGLSGPRAAHHGSLRNYMIGARGLRGGRRPAEFKTGGMVVKNVAGYDVGKFLIGSLGTAGCILEANFKLRSLPDRRSLRLASFRGREETWSFTSKLREARLQPAALVVLDGGAAREIGRHRPGLDAAPHWAAWLFEGNASQVDWQERQVDRMLSDCTPSGLIAVGEDDVQGMLDAFCEFSEPGAQGLPPADLCIARLGALPTESERLERALQAFPESAHTSFATSTDALTGRVTLRWTGRSATLCDSIPRLCAIAASTPAAGVILYLPPAHRPQWPYRLTADPVAHLVENIRRVFDPQNLFCPGRKLAPPSDPADARAPAGDGASSARVGPVDDAARGDDSASGVGAMT